MITILFSIIFYKSGEFDEGKNVFAGIDMLFRIPMFILLDVFLIVQVVNSI